MRWSLVTAGTIVALFALSLAGVLVYKKVVNEPQKQTGYADLRLGMTMAEVKYLKGYPTDVLENPEKQKDTDRYRIVLPIKNLKPDQHVEDYESWHMN